MMHRLLFFITIILITVSFTTAQESTTVSTDSVWKHNLVAGLTLTQVAFTDWAQGGENALAYTMAVDGKSILDEISFNWANNYKVAFGQTRLGNQGLRKTEDIIDLSTVYTLKLGTYINPYGAATLKSQFAKGFTYDAAGNGIQVSKFFDPAYLTQSAGVGYQPIKEFKTRLGLALREIITSDFNQYSDDPKTTEIEKTSVDGGMEWVTNVDWTLDENLLLTEQLELFSPFKDFSEPTIRNTTTVTMKVNKFITTILNLQLVKEPKVSPRTQMKESIAVGISYTIF